MIVLGDVGSPGLWCPGVPRVSRVFCSVIKKTAFCHSLSVVGPVSGWVNLSRDLIVRALVTAVPWSCLIGQSVLSGSQ